MYPPIFEVCSQNLAVVAVLGSNPTRLYPAGEAPPNTPKPYATWQIIGGGPENYLGGHPDMDLHTFQVDVYSDDLTAARFAAQTIRRAVQDHAYITGYGPEGRDPETKNYRYTFNVDWWLEREEEDSMGLIDSIGESIADSYGASGTQPPVDSTGGGNSTTSVTSLTDSTGGQDSAGTSTGTMQTYPTDANVVSMYGSDRYTVAANDGETTEALAVHKTVNNDYTGWSGRRDYTQDANHWVKLNAAGQIELTIQRLDDQGTPEAITDIRIQPEKRNLPYVVNGSTVTITVDQPGPIAVAINDNNTITQNITGTGQHTKQIVKEPLFLFIAPLDENERTAADASSNLLYFGPGVHEIGKEYPLANDTEVYIAGGAVVRGTFKCGNNASNVWIHGRGILTALGLTETEQEEAGWANHAIDMSTNTNGSGNIIEGITIVDPLRSCIVSYQGTAISNVELMSWSHRNDGITAGRNSSIENCFIKVQDDNIKLFYSDVTVSNLVFWQQTAGAVFKLAWDLSNTAQNFDVDNIVVIRSDVFTDYSSEETNRGDMASRSALISALGLDPGAIWRNGTFNNITIEEHNYMRLLNLRGELLHGGKTWGGPGPRNITNLTISNLSMPNAPLKACTIFADDQLAIDGVNLSNWQIGGNAVVGIENFTSQIDGDGFVVVEENGGTVTNLSLVA